jgi:CRISPR/Cas system-associated exonuclease Cas4 (RecB family)
MDTFYQILSPSQAPRLPSHYSHTSLVQIENCPRRWWLSHSGYDGLPRGYPEPVSPAAMLGSIVHATLERFSADYARVISSGDETAIQEFRKQFPLRTTVHAERHAFLQRAKTNVRTDLVALETNVSVDACISLFKDLIRRNFGPAAIESLLIAARTDNGQRQPWVPSAGLPQPESRAKVQVPCPALLPEVDLKIDTPPLRGKIDLAVTEPEGDTLVEYKTGEPKPEHEEQSLLYAFLWWTVTGRLARERQLIYASQETVKLGPVTLAVMEQEAKRAAERVKQARDEIASASPRVHLDSEACRLCPVRQLCSPYWRARETEAGRWTEASLRTADGDRESMKWRDLEIALENVEQLPEGFIAHIGGGDNKKRILCKLPVRFRPASLRSYEAVRLLNVGLIPEGPDALRIVWSNFSEAFWGDGTALEASERKV